MAKLSRTHHQLAKAEKKLRKYSKNQKQFQIQFVRQQRKTANSRLSHMSDVVKKATDTQVTV